MSGNASIDPCNDKSITTFLSIKERVTFVNRGGDGFIFELVFILG